VRAPDGAVRHDFTGRLPFSWPSSAMPPRLDAAGLASGALFARGYGLDYAHPAEAPPYPEAPGVPRDRHAANVLFARGRVTAPWSLYVNDDSAEVRLTQRSQATPSGELAIALGASSLGADWKGGVRSTLRIGGRPVDLRARASAGDALLVRARVDEPAAGRVRLGVRCGAPYGAEVPDAKLSAQQWQNCRAATEPTLDVSEALAHAAHGETVTLAVPLACLVEAGANLSEVEAPFAIATDGRLKIAILDVRFAPATGAACPTH